MKFINEHKTTVIISACAVLILALLIFFGVHSGQTSATEDASLSAITPVQKFCRNFSENFYDITHSLGLIDDLRARVDELTRANTDYEQQLRDSSQLIEENDRLRRMLELRDDNPDLNMVAASVAADEPSNWFSGFTIDKGRNSGIEPDCIVISGDGFLIGKVVQVGANWAKVITITDPGFSAGVMVERSRDLGIAEGDSELRTKMQFRLSFLTRETDIQVDDYITTTGLGGVFPAGFRLGKVTEISDDATTMSMTAAVSACVDLKNLRDVFVITNNMDIVLDEENNNMKAAREKAEREQEEIDRIERERKEENFDDEDSDEDEDEDTDEKHDEETSSNEEDSDYSDDYDDESSMEID